MKALVPVLTRAGMRAVFNASRDGLSAKVSHLAFGDSAYSPTGDETALKSEKVRIPIAGGSWVGGFTVHMTGLLDAGPSFWIKECGMILSDGTLLAVWSDPATPLAYKTDGVPIVTAFDLTLEALPKVPSPSRPGAWTCRCFLAWNSPGSARPSPTISTGIWRRRQSLPSCGDKSPPSTPVCANT